MTMDVFISYKREDQARVIPIVSALEDAGFSVWWDHELPGGEEWRDNISAALDRAKCVVVIWSVHSTGPEGDFVREEASRGSARGVLVPVLIDKVDPPLGFGEIQAIDLRRWNKNTSNPFFTDLKSAIAAKIVGKPVPAAKGPTWRLKRRVTYAAVVPILVFVGLFLAETILGGVQNRLCGSTAMISDVCGALGIGNAATKEERLAWETREPDSCTALSQYIRQYPDSRYADTAQKLIDASELKESETWVKDAKRFPLTLALPRERHPDTPTARQAAQQLGDKQGLDLCEDLAQTTHHQLIKSQVSVEEEGWNCDTRASGIACGLNGSVECIVHVKKVIETRICRDPISVATRKQE